MTEQTVPTDPNEVKREILRKAAELLEKLDKSNERKGQANKHPVIIGTPT